MKVRMKSICVRRLHFVFLSLLILFAESILSAQEIRVSEKDGIKIVQNPKKLKSLPGMPARLELIEELRIGEDTNNEDYWFSSLRSLAVDKEENIIALDWDEAKISVFDKNGRHLLTFGRKGQGPGEIQMPTRMVLAPDDTISILDTGNNRLSFYTIKGEHIESIHMGKQRCVRAMIDSRGCIYGDPYSFGDQPFQNLTRFDADFNPLQILATMEISRDPPPAVAGVLRRFTFQVIANDYFMWADTSKYEFHFHSPEGKHIKTVSRDYDPIRITKADIDREIKKRVGDQPIPQEVIDRAVKKLPKHFQPFYYFVCDEDGRFYVQTLERDEKNWFYFDAYDKDGRYFARFSHPEEELIFTVKKGKMYCLLQEGPDGDPLIKKYKMTWK